MISIGMELEKALKILRSQGLDVQEVVTATVRNDGTAREKEFVIRPQFASEDALILIAASNSEKKELRIIHLNWHIKYMEDTKLPKLYRANRILKVESVDVKILLSNEKAKNAPGTRSGEKPFE